MANNLEKNQPIPFPSVNEHPKEQSRNTVAAGNRVDPRTELITQAFVSIPPLTTRVFQVSEFSRGGMFLNFKDATSTLNDMEHSGVNKGGLIEIAFAISINNKRHHISVRARIARITPRGLGVEFLTHNPPQLSGLRELFPSTPEENFPPHQNTSTSIAPQLEQKVVFKKPAETSAWKEWELLDD